MINAIELKSTNKDTYKNLYGDNLTFLSNVKNINVFIGENNSGKSRLIRAIASSKDAMVLSDQIKDSHKKEMDNLNNNLLSSIEKAHAVYPEIESHPRHRQMSPTELYAYYTEYFNHKDMAQLKFTYPNQNLKQDIQRSLARIYQILCTQSERAQHGISSINRIYIPVLRGIENFNQYFSIKNTSAFNSISMTAEQREAINEYKSNSERIYKNKVSSVYEMNPDTVFTGEALYEVIRDKLLGKETDRLFIRSFEEFISKNFFDGEGFMIIPLINEGYLTVKIGNNEERPLHDLGDGIKQLICILYKAFEQKDSETLFFIEEPEINLHPGYQRKLIDILQQEEFANLYFFISTHSNHFVDRCFDNENISLYKFINLNKENNSFQVISTTHDDIELLNSLGVNNSSVFMSNATIWVEGLTDKLYINKYLQVYIKEKGLQEMKEGVDYAFVEYGGNNITHWSFVMDEGDELFHASGITNRAFIVVDNDNDSAKKAKRKDHLKEVFHNRYLELPVREIENTIKQNVLEATLFRGENISFKKGMEKARDRYDTKSAYIWEYIDRHYDTNPSKQYWDAGTKTPRVNKVKFARAICDNIKSIEDLSQSAFSICEEIYSFLIKIYKDINE